MSITELPVERDIAGCKPGRPVDEAKREAIIAAASASFLDRGYAATAIEQIAADAGVSKVTIYNHFGDKRALFAAAVEAQCTAMRSIFDSENLAQRFDQGSIRESLTAIGSAMMGFLSRPEVVQFEHRIAAETAQDPAIGRLFLDCGPRRMKAAFASLIEALAADGTLHVPDPSLAAEQFVGMCEGLGSLERRFGTPNDHLRNSERIAGAVEVFLAAYHGNG